MAQQVKDLALSLQQLGPVVWYRFDPWPRNFHVPWAWEETKQNKTKHSIIKQSKIKGKEKVLKQ